MAAPKGNKYNEKWTAPKIKKLADEMLAWMTETEEDGSEKPNVFLEDFLILKKGLYRELIGYLSDKSEYFAQAIRTAKQMQEIKLVKLGIADKLQPTLTIFCLKNHHGYKDKQELEHTNKGEKFDTANKTTDELIKRANAINKLDKSDDK